VSAVICILKNNKVKNNEIEYIKGKEEMESITPKKQK